MKSLEETVKDSAGRPVSVKLGLKDRSLLKPENIQKCREAENVTQSVRFYIGRQDEGFCLNIRIRVNAGFLISFINR